MATNSSTTRDSMTPSQAIALVMGAAYTLVGIVGFAVTGTDNFASANTNEALLGFEINPLHNIVHLLIGLAGLAMWRRHDTAQQYGWLLFVGYGAAFLYGLFTVNSTTSANFLSLNGPDMWLHGASALIGLAAALMPARRSAMDTGGRRSGPAPV